MDAQREAERDEEMAEMLFVKRRCCFCIPRFGSNRSQSSVGLNWWQRMRTGAPENDEGWWARSVNAMKKVREWSEIVAGPRWKTFIRRFNRTKSEKNRHGGGKFQYDPLSYALNFDEGHGQNGNSDDDYEFRNFSLRFASVPTTAKSSLDFGKDGPNLL